MFKCLQLYRILKIKILTKKFEGICLVRLSTTQFSYEALDLINLIKIMFHLYLSKQIIYSYLFFKIHYFSRIFLILEIDTNREQLCTYYIMFYLSLLRPMIYNRRLMCWNHN